MTKNARLSLSKIQLASQAGADLLSLCQCVTADGSLAEAEIVELRGWLEEHKETDLPAIAFLVPIVESILEDGVVTDDESKELFVAIERVLPADVRSIAKAARRSVEEAAKEEERAQRTREKEAQRAERERKLPIARFDFMVAGTRYEGRGKVIERYVSEGDSVQLVRDYRNSHSKNAIEIHAHRGAQIGFVPEEDARVLAPLLDAGKRWEATVKKVLTGGRSPLPVVIVSVYSDHAGSAQACSTASKPSGCLGALALLFVAAVGSFGSITWLLAA